MEYYWIVYDSDCDPYNSHLVICDTQKEAIDVITKQSDFEYDDDDELHAKKFVPLKSSESSESNKSSKSSKSSKSNSVEKIWIVFTVDRYGREDYNVMYSELVIASTKKKAIKIYIDSTGFDTDDDYDSDSEQGPPNKMDQLDAINLKPIIIKNSANSKITKQIK
ncbi:hypothetical protein QJ850_gp856 [Acanthamoeba polyphaga mimivirus]|uniref:Uncharacterized protein n=1 Tax=Acanthamoeba polyphaga mimivirus Kroon TaxID=3069720 RepID=A0A0G2Y280_9VIRU|nr:hypothetical protein QJ850_gp856 [Acanthamoeba polyphaga mimivirus]AKI79843.1 hypothetical protein [Acanthamoeba polyphaga mimivirus Kroon]